MEHAAVPSMSKEQTAESWVRAYAGAILKTCFLYLADHDLAKDAMQDTFVKAWKQLDQSDPAAIRNEKAWLMKIAMNTCRDYRRSQWFRRMDLRKSLEELPEKLVAAPDEDRELTMVIGALPDKYKQVILLYYYSNLTLQDTADALGIPKSTANKRLKKAEAILKQSLTGGERE